MEDHEQTNFAQNNQARIRELNDRLRDSGEGGRIVITRGVSALPPNVFTKALAAIRSFDEFADENDIWGEHDFGQLAIEGHESLVWKIDYYDANLEWGSPDPADETLTCRVMTIMLASEL
jgi:hypothetical protein